MWRRQGLREIRLGLGQRLSPGRQDRHLTGRPDKRQSRKLLDGPDSPSRAWGDIDMDIRCVQRAKGVHILLHRVGHARCRQRTTGAVMAAEGRRLRTGISNAAMGGNIDHVDDDAGRFRQHR